MGSTTPHTPRYRFSWWTKTVFHDKMHANHPNSAAHQLRTPAERTEAAAAAREGIGGPRGRRSLGFRACHVRARSGGVVRCAAAHVLRAANTTSRPRERKRELRNEAWTLVACPCWHRRAAPRPSSTSSHTDAPPPLTQGAQRLPRGVVAAARTQATQPRLAGARRHPSSHPR